MAYATPADYRDRFGTSTTSGLYTDGHLQDVLDLTAELLEQELYRSFGVDAAEADHEFVYDGDPFIVPDFAEVSAIDPAGSERRFQRKREPYPYNVIVFDDRTAPRMGDTVTITGKRGWSEVPAAIKQLNIELAGLWLLDGDRVRNQIELGDSPQALTRSAREMIGRVEQAYKFPMEGYGVAQEA